jgi:hypothetical protein
MFTYATARDDVRGGKVATRVGCTDQAEV